VPLVVLPKSLLVVVQVWTLSSSPIPRLGLSLSSFFLSAPQKAARARDRQAAAASQDEADESDATEGRKRQGGENDESGTTARWHEGCSENRRGTAKGDRKPNG